jgi:GT2 family glycosyltransferase
MTAPVISVIVPTHDRRQDLARCLAAIGQQSFRDFEVIVVADSVDEDYLAAVEALLGELPVAGRCIHLSGPKTPRQGPSPVRNAGAAAAAGAYLAFCDDDDLWLATDHLAVAARAFAEDPELDYYFANQIGVSDGALRVRDWLPGLAAGDGKVRIITPGELLAIPAFPHLNTTVVSKRLFVTLDGFDPGLRYSEDFDFSRRATAQARRIAVRPEVVAQHNIPDQARSENASTRLSQRERRLLMTYIQLRLFADIEDGVLRRAAARSLSFEYKRLLERLDRPGDLALARMLARLGLAASPSLKWALVTLALHLPGIAPVMFARLRAASAD